MFAQFLKTNLQVSSSFLLPKFLWGSNGPVIFSLTDRNVPLQSGGFKRQSQTKKRKKSFHSHGKGAFPSCIQHSKCSNHAPKFRPHVPLVQCITGLVVVGKFRDRKPCFLPGKAKGFMQIFPSTNPVMYGIPDISH